MEVWNHPKSLWTNPNSPVTFAERLLEISLAILASKLIDHVTIFLGDNDRTEQYASRPEFSFYRPWFNIGHVLHCNSFILFFHHNKINKRSNFLDGSMLVAMIYISMVGGLLLLKVIFFIGFWRNQSCLTCKYTHIFPELYWQHFHAFQTFSDSMLSN